MRTDRQTYYQKRLEQEERKIQQEQRKMELEERRIEHEERKIEQEERKIEQQIKQNILYEERSKMLSKFNEKKNTSFHHVVDD